MRRVAALIAAALLLAGCGSTTRPVSRSASNLCVDVALATVGPDAAVSDAVLTGLEREIPPGGVDVHGNHVRLCQVGYTAGANATDALSGLLVNAVHAASAQRTIAVIGALSGSAASEADSVLAPAGVSLITPSAPTPLARSALRRPGSGPVPAPRTVYYLLPSQASQQQAVRDVERRYGCGHTAADSRLHGRSLVACAVINDPLCSGVTPAAAIPDRYCVLAGPDLSGFGEPATAYGAAAAEVLLAALNRVATSGGDIANRDTVLGALSRTNLAITPIGAIRFDSAEGILADHFTVYSVQRDGHVVPSLTFTTH